MNIRHIPQVYDILQRWVPDRHVRAALILDLHDSEAAKFNKNFREVTDQLTREHDRRRPIDGTAKE